jgi:hypothetical protein
MLASGTVGAWVSGLGAAVAGESVGQPAFQPYIFWAYGLSCGILLAISLWTVVGLWGLSRRIDDLSERLEAAERNRKP